MYPHVPNKGEQMVRYYGFYSPAFRGMARGKRKKNEQDELIPSILEPDGSSGEYKRNWARLIQKIYEVDPLTCRKCSGKMKVISVIEDEDVIKKILKHLGLPANNILRPNLDTQCYFHYTSTSKKGLLITDASRPSKLKVCETIVFQFWFFQTSSAS